MAELETGVLPPLDSPNGNGDAFLEGEASPNPDAPYGYLKDGVTPAKKRGRKPGSGGGTGSRSSGDAALATRIANELVEVSVPLAFVSPMAMVHVEKSADKTGAALVSISKKYPRIRVAIDSYFNSVAYKDLILFVTGIPVAVMMDYQMLKPDSKIGIPWGMEKIYWECYGENGSETKPDNRVPLRGLASEL